MANELEADDNILTEEEMQQRREKPHFDTLEKIADEGMSDASAEDKASDLGPEGKKKPGSVKSQFSLWYLESEVIQENERLFRNHLAGAYASLQDGLILFSIASGTWDIVKHGVLVENAKTYEDIEERFSQLNLFAVKIGAVLGDNKKFQSGWGEYAQYLIDIRKLWSDIMLTKASVGLCIRFKREDKMLAALARYSRNPTKAVATGEEI